MPAEYNTLPAHLDTDRYRDDGTAGDSGCIVRPSGKIKIDCYTLFALSIIVVLINMAGIVSMINGFRIMHMQSDIAFIKNAVSQLNITQINDTLMRH